MSNPNIEPFMCKCGHELEVHIQFEEITAAGLKHKCHGKTADGKDCPCKILERAND